jgi:NAD(P)-dependent dehydrogenase (short-subunit alcohol dehydrogenase family)
MRLQGKAAIVTGAGSGIGKATAELFAKEGAQVLTVDLPGKATDLEIDIAADGAPKAIVNAAVSKFGRLDIVMNNAGTGSNQLAEEFKREAWDRVVAVNMTAPFFICQAAIPHLRASGAGRIINVASVMAEGTDYGLSAYCASKAGVAGFTRTLALELGKFKITANYLLPGAIRTGMTSPLWDARPEVAEIWAKKSALRRLGQPDDLAKAALFLASDDSAFVTGHGLTVDGGLMLRV